MEEQTLGRTSRQGNLGTGQLIINNMAAIASLDLDEEDKNHSIKSVDDLKKLRDRIETRRLERIRKVELDKIITKDELFNRFSQLIQTLRQADNNISMIAEIEEKWGFWFHKAVQIIDKESVFDKVALFGDLEIFLHQAESDFKNHRMQNISHLIFAENEVNQALHKLLSLDSFNSGFSFRQSIIVHSQINHSSPGQSFK